MLKGFKGSGSKVVIIVVACLFAVMIVAGQVLGLFDAILGKIDKAVAAVLQTILDLIHDPIGWVEKKWAGIKNFTGKLFNKGTFDESAYNDYKVDPSVCLSQDQFNQIRTDLDEAIDRDTVGLDNIMLKKILMANYSGIYLKDTNVMVELTPEDLGMSSEEYLNYFTITTEKSVNGETLAEGAGWSFVAGAAAGLAFSLIPGVNVVAWAAVGIRRGNWYGCKSGWKLQES